MCHCDNWFFTINRADHFMVGRLEKSDGMFSPSNQIPPIYEIEPSLLFEIIECAISSGWVDIEVEGDFVYIKGKDG